MRKQPTGRDLVHTALPSLALEPAPHPRLAERGAALRQRRGAVRLDLVPGRDAHLVEIGLVDFGSATRAAPALFP